VRSPTRATPSDSMPTGPAGTPDTSRADDLRPRRRAGWKKRRRRMAFSLA
jgi:hypothetical protein